MALTWMDLSVITFLVSLGAVVMTQGVSYLIRRDAQEVHRNRQDACRRHEWVKREPAGLVCHLCGKIPG